jgi:hypothetical protein
VLRAIGTVWLTLVACGDDGVTLSVDVKTDYVPGVEFTRVETTLELGGAERPAIPAGVSLADDFIAGVRVAEYDGLIEGEAMLRIGLRNAEGDLVASKSASIPIRGATGATIAITRSCAGVSCPGPRDATDATECINGTCVSPECGVERPDECAIECGACTSEVACVEAVCSAGACLHAARHERCGVAQRCDPIIGCEVAPPDAGVPDASVRRDAGFDAGFDAGSLSLDAGGPLGLIAYWDCEEIGARGLHDVSGHGHDGVCTSCPSIAAGWRGNGCDFRASERDGIVVEDHPDLDPPVLTLALFVRVRSGEASLIAKPIGTGSANSYQLELREFDPGLPAPDVAIFTTTPDSTTWEHIDHYFEPAGRWVHLAATWDGRHKRLYVDGVLEGEADGTIASGPYDLLIGYDANGEGGGEWLFLDGILDEIRVYDRVLSGAEITSLLERGP